MTTNEAVNYVMKSLVTDHDRPFKQTLTNAIPDELVVKLVASNKDSVIKLALEKALDRMTPEARYSFRWEEQGVMVRQIKQAIGEMCKEHGFGAALAGG
ncbi:MAG: hypothetical protein LW823_03875 [Rickettsiales bacterium]|nr:hypothetical protein [Rickettsiales bacterium]